MARHGRSTELLFFLALIATPGACCDGACASEKPANSSRRLDRHGDPLPVGALARLGTLRLRHHDDGVFALVFSTDGNTVITGGRDKAIRFWDVNTGREVRRMPGPANESVSSLALSPDRKLLAVGGSFHIHLCEIATGRELRQLAVQRGPVWSLAFAPDGNTLASSSSDDVRLWNTATGALIHQCAGHQEKVNSVAFTPDGQCLASGGDDRVVRLWDVASGKEIGRFDGHQRGVHQVLFTPDGTSLASSGYNDRLRFWNPTAINACADMPSQGPFAWTRNGKTMAMVADAVVLIDLSSGRELRRLSPPDFPIRTLVFSPDDKTLAAGCADSQVRLWEVATGKELFRPIGHYSGVGSLAFLQDGKHIVTASGRYDLTYRMWDAATGREGRRFTVRGCNIPELAVAPDGAMLALACTDHLVRLADPDTGAEIRQLKGHENLVQAVAFSPNGKMLASGGWDRTARLWDVTTGKELRRLIGHRTPVACLAFSPDGATVASAGGSHTDWVRLWDVTSGQELRKLGTLDDWCQIVAFAPDGSMVAGSGRRGVILWDAATGAEIGRFGGNTIEPAQIALAADGRTLWIKNPDHSLTLWEVATGLVRRRLAGHGATTRSLALAPDGRTLATGSADTTVLIWDATGLTDGTKPGVILTQAELDCFWNDIAERDGLRAHRAVWALIGAPHQAATMLRERLRGVPYERVRRLIAELNDERFRIRDRASRELGLLHRAVETALKQALAETTSLEVRRRIEQLMAKSEAEVSAGVHLRMLRSIEVLEAIATKAALQTLEDLVQSVPGSTEHTQATAAVRRLKAKQPRE